MCVHVCILDGGGGFFEKVLSLHNLCFKVNGTAIDFGSNLEVFSPDNAEEASALRMTASESSES